MAFVDIPGNARAKKILSSALSRGKLPNSLIFSGPEGIGKLEIALTVAKALNCHQKQDDACEQCSACEAINKGTFPDLMLLTPEKDILKIEQMRLLKEAAYLKPMVGKRRIFIIADAEKMNKEAGNSLLKILEEPPFFSHIMLITQNPFIILPTVKSRCQGLKFSPIPREEIENRLVAANMDREKAKLLSFLVCGNLRRAVELDWEEIQEQRKKAWRIFKILVKGEDAAAILKAYAFRSRSQVEDELKAILEMLSSFCRDLILIKENGDAGLLINPDYEDKMRSLQDKLELEQFLNLFIKIEDSLSALKRNVNIKVYISSMLLKLMDRNNV